MKFIQRPRCEIMTLMLNRLWQRQSCVMWHPPTLQVTSWPCWPRRARCAGTGLPWCRRPSPSAVGRRAARRCRSRRTSSSSPSSCARTRYYPVWEGVDIVILVYKVRGGVVCSHPGQKIFMEARLFLWHRCVQAFSCIGQMSGCQQCEVATAATAAQKQIDRHFMNDT